MSFDVDAPQASYTTLILNSTTILPGGSLQTPYYSGAGQLNLQSQVSNQGLMDLTGLITVTLATGASIANSGTLGAGTLTITGSSSVSVTSSGTISASQLTIGPTFVYTGGSVTGISISTT